MQNISQYLAMLILNIAAFAFLVIATVTDIKNNTISIGLFPSLLIVAFVLKAGCFGAQWPLCVLTGIGLGAGFLVPAMLGRGGGGDAIMLCCLGLCFGPYVMFVVLLGMFVGILLIGIYKLIKEKLSAIGIIEVITMDLPMAPFALFGFITYMAVEQIWGVML